MQSKRFQAILIAVFALLTAFHSPVVPRTSGENQKEKELNAILDRCAEYCSRLAGSALDFICMEEIYEKMYTTPPSTSNISYQRNVGGVNQTYYKRMLAKYKHTNWIYDYQLIRKEGQVIERRILLKEDGKEKREENAQLKTQGFRHKMVIFGPFGLLSREAQQRHDYNLKKYLKYKGDPAIIIEAKPRENSTGDGLYGKVWVKRDDYSILKIEFEPESLTNYGAIQALADKIQAKPRLILEADYDYEKNGIRFPSRYMVRESYIFRTSGRRLNRSETVVNYRDYQFFTVATDINIKED